jgi:hypothetical protein
MKEASTDPKQRSQPRINASQESRQSDADNNAGDEGLPSNSEREGTESGRVPDPQSNKKKRKSPDGSEASMQLHLYSLYAVYRKYQPGFVKAGMMSAPIGPDGAGVLHALAKNLSR